MYKSWYWQRTSLSLPSRTSRSVRLKEMLHVVSIVGVALLLAPSVLSQNTTIPIVVPDDATALSPNLLGFSLEQDRWPDWSGKWSRNEFTHNALLNYARLTGKPPKIRVGANTEDRTVWSPTTTVSQ